MTIALLAIPLLLSGEIGTKVSQDVRSVELDAQECYRIREVQFSRGGVQFALTDGYLIFSKPVLGAPIAAFFTSAVEGGDGEVLLLPPDPDERRVLSKYTNRPNLNEHLREAIFFFADDTAEEIRKQIRGSEVMHNDPVRGAELAEKYTPVLRNVAGQFDTRLILDLLTSDHLPGRFFAALLGGTTLGNFHVVFDPRVSEQVMAGQQNESAFQIWTSFTPKALRHIPREVDFRAANYKIEAALDSNLHMKVTTSFEVKDQAVDPLRALSFDLSRQMRILSATIDGQPADVVESLIPNDPALDSDDRLFVLVPVKPLSKSSDHIVTVTHEGDVITAGPNKVYFVGSRGRWYPHRPFEFARFELRFRFPKELDLISAGTAVSEETDGKERIIERLIDTPVPVAGFNLGTYKRTAAKRGDLSVEICSNRSSENSFPAPQLPAEPSPRGHRIRPGLEEAQAADTGDRNEALANDIADVLEFYAHRFGPPPVKRLEVTPIPGRFGQGFSGLIYLSQMAYMNPSGRVFSELPADQKLFFTQLMYAHEVAHQWWGNTVLTAGYHDEWISEALSNYSAMLYLEKHLGAGAVSTLLDAYREALLRKTSQGATREQAGPVTQGRRLELDGEQNAWVAVMYGKGTWIIRMLQARLGEEAFLKMLQTLRERYERKTLSTEQFRLLCAEFTPKGQPDRNLEEFFNQWVYGTGVPALKLSSSVKGSPGALRLEGTLTQSEVAEVFSADFPVMVQVRGKKRVLWVRSSSDGTQFSVPVAARPDRVTLDPDEQFLIRR